MRPGLVLLVVLLISLVHSAHSAVLAEANTIFSIICRYFSCNLRPRNFSLVFSFMRLNHWSKGPQKGL